MVNKDDSLINFLKNKNTLMKIWEGEPLIKGNVYFLKTPSNPNGAYYRYVGEIENVAEIQNITCCYTIGDRLLVHVYKPDINKPGKIEKRKRSDDERLIDTEIKDTDNELMVCIKSVIKELGITRGDFKALYDNISDMNNSLRCIEKGENLSWSRYIDLCRRLGVSYVLRMYKDVDMLEEIDTRNV